MHINRPTAFNLKLLIGEQCMLQDSEQIWLEKRLMERQVWTSKAKKTEYNKREHILRSFLFSFSLNSLFSSYTEVNVCHSGRMVGGCGHETRVRMSERVQLVFHSDWLFSLPMAAFSFTLSGLLLCSFLGLGGGRRMAAGERRY